MKKRASSWIWVLSVAVAVAGIATVRVAAADEDQGFAAQKYVGNNGEELLYRFHKPAEFDPNAGPYPVLIFLHGAGERGNDNTAQLKHGKDFLLKAANEQQCFVIAPQCPRSKRWAEVNWFAPTHKMPEQPSDPMGLLLELLAKMQKQYPLDTQRFYVMGLSMGGYGTWDLLQRCPGKFAAAVPICGGGDETGASEVVKTPVWAFHGDKDGAVPVARSRNMIKALKAAGGEPKYTEYAGVGHNVWDRVFNDPEVGKWLFSQKRPTETKAE